MASVHPYYLIWTGRLNMGDTPGVFMDSQFVGLLLQIPISITFESGNASELLLMTTDVEIFDNNKHPAYWDWEPGTNFPSPIGFIDDTDPIPGRPEYHRLTVPAGSATVGKHSITIKVNSAVAAGFRDDFVIKRIEAREDFGAKIGW